MFLQLFSVKTSVGWPSVSLLVPWTMIFQYYSAQPRPSGFTDGTLVRRIEDESVQSYCGNL